MMDESNQITQIPVAGMDWDGLNSIAEASDANLLRATLDDSDLDVLSRLVRTNLVDALNQNEELQWFESGYFISWLLLLLALSWFRRGWTII